jgi:hypothetical protein
MSKKQGWRAWVGRIEVVGCYWHGNETSSCTNRVDFLTIWGAVSFWMGIYCCVVRTSWPTHHMLWYAWRCLGNSENYNDFKLHCFQKSETQRGAVLSKTSLLRCLRGAVCCYAAVVVCKFCSLQLARWANSFTFTCDSVVLAAHCTALYHTHLPRHRWLSTNSSQTSALT